MKNFAMLLGVFLVAITVPMLASGAEQQMNSAICTLEDGKQVSLQYQIDDLTNLRTGRMWPQTDRPMLLFSETPLRVEGSSIPIGAFRVYVIPDKGRWTLVVNRNVGGEYHPEQDLVRVSMVTGGVTRSETEHKIWFGRSAPGRCELRIYDGGTAAAVEFEEQQ